MGDEEAEWFQVCAYCGTPLDVGESHPVHVERDDDDGDLRFDSFCDEECKENWLTDRMGPGTRWYYLPDIVRTAGRPVWVDWRAVRSVPSKSGVQIAATKSLKFLLEAQIVILMFCNSVLMRSLIRPLYHFPWVSIARYALCIGHGILRQSVIAHIGTYESLR